LCTHVYFYFYIYIIIYINILFYGVNTHIHIVNMSYYFMESDNESMSDFQIL
jgi:hypothetical protein